MKAAEIENGVKDKKQLEAIQPAGNTVRQCKQPELQAREVSTLFEP